MTGRASQRKGYQFMRNITDYLNAYGHPHATIRSKGQSGSDILETPGICWELKAVQKTSLGLWVDQATQDANREGADVAVVVHKRRGTTDPSQQFATCTLETFNYLLRQAGYGDIYDRPQRH